MRPLRRSKQGYFAVLSLVLAVFLVVGIFWGPRFFFNRTEDKSQSVITTDQSQPKASQELAETAVNAMEIKQTQESVKQAEDLVQGLNAGTIKNNLKARIMLIKTKIQNREVAEKAERAVAYLEVHVNLSNVSLAKEAIEKVTDPHLKRTLQERINKVQEQLTNEESQSSEVGTVSSNVTIQPVAPVEEYIEEVNVESLDEEVVAEVNSAETEKHEGGVSVPAVVEVTNTTAPLNDIENRE